MGIREAKYLFGGVGVQVDFVGVQVTPNYIGFMSEWHIYPTQWCLVDTVSCCISTSALVQCVLVLQIVVELQGCLRVTMYLFGECLCEPYSYTSVSLGDHSTGGLKYSVPADVRLGDLVSAMVFAKATICLVNGCMAARAGLFGLAYVRATQIPDYMYVEDTNRSFRSYLGNMLFN